MRILLTNDDGFNAPGIMAIAREMQKDHEIIIAAPKNQKSASSHSISIRQPLLVREEKLQGINGKIYSIDGTPADCVRVAMDKLVDGKVDLIVSGINYGLNSGTDILYSGTVSAAIEGSMHGLPAIALSQDVNEDFDSFDLSSIYGKKIIEDAMNRGFEKGMVLNVNFPIAYKDTFKGIKVCKVGVKSYTNSYVPIKEEQDGIIYELRDENIDITHENTDTFFLKDGFITISPLQYDLTNFNTIIEIENWF